MGEGGGDLTEKMENIYSRFLSQLLIGVHFISDYCSIT